MPATSRASIAADTATPTTRMPRRRVSFTDGALMIAWRVAVTILVTFFAVAAIREPASTTRLMLVALAGAIAAFPFALQALDQRRRREAAAARAQAHTRTKDDIQDAVRAQAADIDRLRERHASASPAAWRATLEAYAETRIVPALAHAVPPGAHATVVSLSVTALTAFLATRPALRPRDAATLVDQCVATINAAGWETWVTPGDVVAARRAGVRALFFCVDANTRIDKAAIDMARAKCETAGVRCGAFISAQIYSKAALEYARRHRVGLIRPEHIGKMLTWASRAVKPVRKAA